MCQPRFFHVLGLKLDFKKDNHSLLSLIHSQTESTKESKNKLSKTELNIGVDVSRLPTMGELKPSIIDEGLCELLSMINIPELPFGSFPQVPSTEEIWDGVSNPKDMVSFDLKIMQS